jgi:hypothetical protein
MKRRKASRVVLTWDGKLVEALKAAHAEATEHIRHWMFWDSVRALLERDTGSKCTILAVKRKCQKLGLQPKLRPTDAPCVQCGKPQGCRSAAGQCRPCYAKEYYKYYSQIK